MRLWPRFSDKILAAVLFAFAILTMAFPISASANDPSLVKVRPKIPGDYVPDFKVQDLIGNTKFFRNLIKDKFVMVAFIPTLPTEQDNVRAYFQMIRPFILQQGYEIFIISTPQTAKVRAELYNRKVPDLFFDADRSGFISMGLTDSVSENASVIPAIFFIGPNGKVLSTFASSDPKIQFSGDSLVLAARVGKRYDANTELSPFRDGPTTAPLPLMPIPPLPAASSSIDMARAERGETPLIDKIAPRPSNGGSNFALPDDSVLNLLTVDDLSHTNSLWMSGFVGVTAYDARRNAWSPRWSPGFQFGRRFNRVGIFLNAALDQTFDLTQEVKRLDVIHLGIGLESLAMYGRVRTSLSTGLAILNSDTDIDSRGKIGWYVDLRPIGFRWRGGQRGAFEITPLALNISVPVTRGIPLILVGYMTMLTYEFATPVPQ